MSAAPQGRRGALMACAGLTALAAIGALALAQEPPPGATVHRSVLFGRSALGRPLRALEVGDPRAARRVLVIGCIHGNECAGVAITRRLAAMGALAGVDLWLIESVNPDGMVAHRRQNSHGVDLNRNFPYAWRRLDRPGGLYWAGRRALSEPESQAARRLILRLGPDVTVWYHQHMRLVDESGGDPVLERRYARLVGLPLRRLPRPPGSATSWQNHLVRARAHRSASFVVELPAGRLPPAAVARHAGAVLELARDGGAGARTARARPPAAPLQGRATAEARPAPPPHSLAVRPRIVQRRIPFFARRREEMAAYGLRHYGLRSWRLNAPRVIVEHYAQASSAAAVYNTFAPDRPDPELHELPGTCAHFVVARDGTIFQLVDLGTMCRHAVGLNWTAIGIEHVGFSDREVLGNPRQLAASLRLTRWLRCSRGIAVGDVIGHAESLSSPYHHERIARLRSQTHGDLRRASMTGYRARLARLRC